MSYALEKLLYKVPRLKYVAMATENRLWHTVMGLLI